MLDYNIEDAQRILKSFDYSNLRLEDHVLDNWFEIDDFEGITVITAYSFSKSRGKREIERKG